MEKENKRTSKLPFVVGIAVMALLALGIIRGERYYAASPYSRQMAREKEGFRDAFVGYERMRRESTRADGYVYSDEEARALVSGRDEILEEMRADLRRNHRVWFVCQDGWFRFEGDGHIVTPDPGVVLIW